MTDEEKLYGAYYELDRLWTGGKVIKELHKITSLSKKDSCLKNSCLKNTTLKNTTKSWQNFCLNQWLLKSFRTLKKFQQFGSKI